MKKKQYQFWFDEELKSLTRHVSKEARYSTSQIIQESLRWVLMGCPEPRPKAIADIQQVSMAAIADGTWTNS